MTDTLYVAGYSATRSGTPNFSASWTVYDAYTGGTRLTALKDVDGQAITVVTPESSDASRRFYVTGFDQTVYLDDGSGPREPIEPTSLAVRIRNLEDAGPGESSVADHALTRAKLQQIAALRVLGNVTGGTTDVTDVTVAQLVAAMSLATTTLKGLLPATGTPAGHVLFDNLTWGDPADSDTLSLLSPATNDVVYWTGLQWAAGRLPTFALQLAISGDLQAAMVSGFVPVLFDVQAAAFTGYLSLQPEGADVTVEVHRIAATTGADTVLGTTTPSLTFTQASKMYATFSFTAVNLTAGDLLYLKVLQAGSTQPGSDLLVTVHGPGATIPSLYAAPSTPTIAGSVSSQQVTLTITAGGGGGPVVGWQIFRDGVLIDRIPAATLTYLDTTAGATSHSYTVVGYNAHRRGSASTAYVSANVDYSFTFPGALAAALDGTDWPDVNDLAASGGLVDQGGNGYMRLQSGTAGGFVKSYARSRVTTGAPITLQSELLVGTAGTSSGNIDIITRGDVGTGTGPGIAGVGPTKIQYQIKLSTTNSCNLFYKTSAGSSTAGFVYNRGGTALIANARLAFEIKEYTSGSNTIIEYREWDATSGSRPSAVTATSTIATASLPASGYVWVEIEGPSAASNATQYIGPITISLS